MEGYIKLYRSIQENPIWHNEPFTKAQAWVDLLLMANHKDNEFMLGNEFVKVKSGSFITSEVKLSQKWKWSRKKVRGFLIGLESGKMLVKKGTSKYTSVTIVNWAIYQNEGTSKDTTKEQVRNIKGTSKEHQRNTNKNDKECIRMIKNDKKVVVTTAEKSYEENIGMISPFISESIQHLVVDGIDEELIIEYIKEATLRNKKSWKYIQAMALGNLKKNIKTVEQYRASELERDVSKKEQQKQDSKKSYKNFEERDYQDDEFEKYFDNL